ncbi:MAG: RNA chaperone Hfq [Pseudomonadota bacterium]
MEQNSLEHEYLKKLYEQSCLALIYLKNGLCLRGYLEKYNDVAFLLRLENKFQLVFRDKIATIVNTRHKKSTISRRRRVL